MMHFLRFILICFPLSIGSLQAQEQFFEIEVSTDSIYLGNSFEIRFVAENIRGTFEPPAFEGFEMVGGPNQTNRMQFVNGITAQSSSYSLRLKPLEPGVLFIPPAYYVSEDKTWETRPVEIYCLPNPEGISQESYLPDDDSSELSDWFGRESLEKTAKKKKLKVTKI